MKKHIISTGLLSLLILSGCSDYEYEIPGQNADERTVISLTGEISQECVSRANDGGFAYGDEIGVYIVDYEGTIPGALKSQGNRADNVRHTYDAASRRWKADYDLYWKDKHTRIDVYGYYPYGSPDNVNNYKFTVRTNQNRTYDDGTMGDYEASDFLWGKVDGVEPTAKVIPLPLSHRMANARITLVEGSGFDAGEWASLEKQVLVVNTVQDAVIDLATGTVTPDGKIDANAIVPSKRDDEWRAIVVPQAVAAGTTMFSITLGGIPYKFSKNEEYTYISGKMNNFGIKVDKRQATGDYTLTLISESITAWENDLVSHDAVAKEYIVVNSTAGALKDAITKAGKDYTKVRNLKVTGEINLLDFNFMRNEMESLEALNLKEVVIKSYYNSNIIGSRYYRADQIPEEAFYKKKLLTHFVFPDKLNSIGKLSFAQSGLSGSLIIPEGVVDIQDRAFYQCTSLSGTLSLPSTLEYIGNPKDVGQFDENKQDEASGYTFQGCGFYSELVIPEKVKYIGGRSFYGGNGLYGNLLLPASLKVIGDYAFASCPNLTGSLKIPEKVEIIGASAFSSCGFDGNLTLHNGIKMIGSSAFSGCHFKGELVLPKNIVKIDNFAFSGNDFSGELILPESLSSIGIFAFDGNWRLSGTLKFGEEMTSIGISAFSGCRGIEKLVFSKNIETIGSDAFANCSGVNAIVCEGLTPPYLMTGVFNGVAKDNFTLEVPEASIVQYQTTGGWSDFKRIAAHHELVCRPAVACALSTERQQTLVIDAEGEWELASKPDWCELSQTSGFKKTEITLTIRQSSKTESREGDVVFRLKDKDYTHKCHVSQYGYEYDEDEYITLQQASKGNNGGINIVILGDGYNAKEIADGSYLSDMRAQVENFFGVEPYKTYRDYFNVYTAFPVSVESGVGTINTLRYNRFNTTYTGGVGLKCDFDELNAYVLKAPTVNEGNFGQTLTIVVPNSNDYGGVTQMWTNGYAVAFCPKSDYGYPLDTRGVIQHEAGGHGFGKLGDEYIYHNAFIDACGCNCCAHVAELKSAKSLGWYDNLELTGKMHEVGWSHLIFDPRYSSIVDIYEGGYMHSRGVFRSEPNSCMNNNIPYFSTISRESIVKRIKLYAGEEFDFEEFVALDKRSAAANVSRSVDFGVTNAGMRSMSPVIHKGNPLSGRKNR